MWHIVGKKAFQNPGACEKSHGFDCRPAHLLEVHGDYNLFLISLMSLMTSCLTLLRGLIVGS